VPVWAYAGVVNPSAEFQGQDVSVKRHPKPVQRIVVVNPLESIRQLVGQGNFKQARLILSAIEKAKSQPQAGQVGKRVKFDLTEISFLYGLIEIGEGTPKLAVKRFETILINQPNLVRVRLELARALFIDGQDVRAKYHFDLAGQGDLPAKAKENIGRFLAQIRERKAWAFSFTVGLAPDSNINTATDSDTVDLFGLPFSLDDDAQSRSGIGVMATSSVQYYGPLEGDWRLLGNAQGQRYDYGGSTFDDSLASSAIGVGKVLDNGFTSVQLTGFKRWFGGQAFNNGLGARGFWQMRLSDTRRLRLSVSTQKMTYDQNPVKDGWVYSSSAAMQLGLDSSSFIEASLGLSREEAQIAPQKSWAFRGELSYFKELPNGITIKPFAEAQYRPFDAVQPVFGLTRKDWALTGGVELTARKWNWKGFAPFISYAFTNNSSTIDLFKFNRHRVKLGFTRAF
jgi:hypothetical protein